MMVFTTLSGKDSKFFLFFTDSISSDQQMTETVKDRQFTKKSRMTMLFYLLSTAKLSEKLRELTLEFQEILTVFKEKLYF